MEHFKYLNIDRNASGQVVNLLKNNIIGTPGKGMLYRHLKVQQKLDYISSAYFVNLRRKSNLAGTCCLCERNVKNAGVGIDAFYIRYFSFLEVFRLKKASADSGLDGRSKKGIKAEIEEIFSKHPGDPSGQKKTLFYAYVDPDNERSKNICRQFDFRKVGEFNTIVFSRLYPELQKDVHEIQTDELPAIKALLQKEYSSFNFYTEENLNFEDGYFAVKDNKGTVVAGLKAHKEAWEISGMPGVGGKVIMSIVPRIPVINKLFNKNYRFAAVEALYCAPGHEKLLERLLESVLAKYNVTSAVMWLDNSSRIYKTIKSLDLGLLNKINKEVKADVIARFINFEEEEVDNFKNHPVYVSAFDLT